LTTHNEKSHRKVAFLLEIDGHPLLRQLPSFGLHATRKRGPSGLHFLGAGLMVPRKDPRTPVTPAIHPNIVAAQGERRATR